MMGLAQAEKEYSARGGTIKGCIYSSDFIVFR